MLFMTARNDQILFCNFAMGQFRFAATYASMWLNAVVLTGVNLHTSAKSPWAPNPELLLYRDRYFSLKQLLYQAIVGNVANKKESLMPILNLQDSGINVMKCFDLSGIN